MNWAALTTEPNAKTIEIILESSSNNSDGNNKCHCGHEFEFSPSANLNTLHFKMFLFFSTVNVYLFSARFYFIELLRDEN